MKKGKDFKRKYLWAAPIGLYLINLPIGLVGLMLLIYKKLQNLPSRPKRIGVNSSKRRSSHASYSPDKI